MTHYHFSTLGQCLISLAKQGITSPLKRVLRFIEAGAVVPPPTNPDTLSTTDHKESLDKSLTCLQYQKAKTPSCALKKSTILSGVVKVDFSKAKALLDQINLISAPHCAQDPVTEKFEDKMIKSLSSWTSMSDESDLDVPISLPQYSDHLDLPKAQPKNSCTTILEDILPPETKMKTQCSQQNCDKQQPTKPKTTKYVIDTSLPPPEKQIQWEDVLKEVQETILLPQIERETRNKKQQQQQIQENKQLQAQQPQEIEQSQKEMTNSPLNNKNWPQKDITELAKKLELAAAVNETFQNDLSHLIENVFMDKSIKRPIKVRVTNETNLFQLRYATSFQYLPCDLYNLSIGFVTMKGRQQVTTVDEAFLRKHTVGEVFEHSELTHGTIEIYDLFQMTTMEELMEYFNEKVLKRERFSKEMYAAVEQIANNVLKEIETDEQFRQY